MQDEDDLRTAQEFIPGRLYYIALKSSPRQTSSAHFFWYVIVA